MNFADLDINGLIALGVGVVTLINTIAQLFMNARTKATEADVIEVKQVIQENKVHAKEERERMETVFDEALMSMKKAKRK